uniref:NAC domain-containing protein n=1 Tax=Leersia perrieri TaxID=77586 RepID=A0A0D9W0L7_9ORYZ
MASINPAAGEVAGKLAAAATTVRAPPPASRYSAYHPAAGSYAANTYSRSPAMINSPSLPPAPPQPITFFEPNQDRLPTFTAGHGFLPPAAVMSMTTPPLAATSGNHHHNAVVPIPNAPPQEPPKCRRRRNNPAAASHQSSVITDAAPPESDQRAAAAASRPATTTTPAIVPHHNDINQLTSPLFLDTNYTTTTTTTSINNKQKWQLTNRPRTHHPLPHKNTSSVTECLPTSSTDVVDDGEVTGRVNTLTLALGHQPNGVSTHWRMKEYRIPEFQIPPGHDSTQLLDEWVLCKLYHSYAYKQKGKGKVHEEASKPDEVVEDLSVVEYDIRDKPDGAIQGMGVDEYGIRDKQDDPDRGVQKT